MNVLSAVFLFVNQHPEVIGIVLPPFIDWLNRDVHIDEERMLVSILVCLFIAIGLHFNQLLGGSIQQLASSFAIIFFESNTVYKLYFKNSQLRANLTK